METKRISTRIPRRLASAEHPPTCWLFTVSLCLLYAPSVIAGQPEATFALCDTIYVGPRDGAWQYATNWTHGIPTAGRSACLVDGDAVRHAVISEEGHVIAVAESQGDPPGAAAPADLAFSQYPPPPAPTDFGACCLGSVCVETDYFGCLSMCGYFRPATLCDFGGCETGACCRPDLTCADTSGVGQPMTEADCATQNGTYLGGASCGTTDTCARSRIPGGFEIVEISYAPNWHHGRPRVNNCGEVAYELAQVFVELYDNGITMRFTDPAHYGFRFPDINDHGVIALTAGDDGAGGGGIRILKNGVTTSLGEGAAPSINDLGHVAWMRPQPGGCFGFSIIRFDGVSTSPVFVDPDGLSNQMVHMNNLDECAWTQYDFCSGSELGWIANILLATSQSVLVLPSTFPQCQTGNGRILDDSTRAVWRCGGSILEVFSQGTSSVYGSGDAPEVTSAGAMVFAFDARQPSTPFQAKLDRSGQVYLLSDPREIGEAIRNDVPGANELDEVAWEFAPTAGLTPSGIRYMRRIRNGDVDFDGSVTMADFVPFPGCFTNGEKQDGLCECRFYDIDHDRDIDDDDFALFLRVYTGPLDDCNGNGTSDLVELLHGETRDADLNGVIDTCEVLADPAKDLDGDGMIDAACVPIAPSAPWASLGLTASAVGEGPLPDGRGTEGPVAGARGSVQSTIDNRQSTIPFPQSTIDNRQSTIPPPQSAIGNRQSAITAAPTGRYLAFTVDPGIPPTMNRPAFALDPASGGWPTEPPYLSTRKYRFQGTSGIPRMAVKVNFVMLPGAYNIYDGTSAWVDTPRAVSELPGKGFNDPVGSDRTFLAARLTDHPVYADFATMGTVYVYDERIIPSRKLPGQTLEPAVYSVQTVIEGCGLATDLNLSPALDVINARWSDLALLVEGQFAAPDGQVSIDDTLAALAKFSGAAGAPTKPRADLLGAGPTGPTGAVDGKIDISDIIATLNAFAGAEYPFAPQ